MQQHPALLVTLENSIDEETAEDVARLLRLLRGVADVSPLDGEPNVEQITTMRVNAAWRAKLHRMSNER